MRLELTRFPASPSSWCVCHFATRTLRTANVKFFIKCFQNFFIQVNPEFEIRNRELLSKVCHNGHRSIISHGNAAAAYAIISAVNGECAFQLRLFRDLHKGEWNE